MVVKTVGVIGAGQMGGGIAAMLAVAGYDVTLMDIDKSALHKGLLKIREEFERQISCGKMTSELTDASLRRIATAVKLCDVGNNDLIIEAATEREVVKQKIFEDLAPHLKPSAIITTNTSSLSITKLAAHSGRPSQFMGLHFMNPVRVMRLVELVRGIATSPETFHAVREVVKQLGRKEVISEDSPTFIVNRVLIPMINEAVYTVYEGVGTVTDVDNGLKRGANHPMGPLELADFIGLDTCLDIMNVLFHGIESSRYRPCPLLVKYVEAGWVGQKVGKGFYDYTGPTPTPTR